MIAVEGYGGRMLATTRWGSGFVALLIMVSAALGEETCKKEYPTPTWRITRSAVGLGVDRKAAIADLKVGLITRPYTASPKLATDLAE